jgi:hypothetical protein
MRVGERMNRRIFLRGAGAVTFLIAGGGAWYSYEEGAFSLGKGPAFAPWNDWNKPRTGTLALVRAAILAASPHNTQPWLFRVNGNEIQLFSDRTRNTGVPARAACWFGVRSRKYVCRGSDGRVFCHR